MPPARYRKKPVIIDAVQWTGENDHELVDFVDAYAGPGEPDRVHFADRMNGEYETVRVFYVDTLEGPMSGNRGDWLIRGIKGEFYPCKNEIFEATYEPVE